MLTSDFICDACRRRVQHAVDGLLRMYVQLDVELLHLPVAADGPVGSATESKPPLRIHILEFMDRLRDTADGWVRVIRTERHYTEPWAAPTRGAAMMAAQRFLRAHQDYLLDSPHAVRFASDLLHLEHRGRQILGWNRLVHHLPVPCPYCDLLALVRVDGDDRVFCTVCATAWSEDDYRRLVLILAQEHDAAAC